MPLELQKVTQKVIYERVKEPGVICAGSTIDLEHHKAEYEREGYEGTMYYTETKNMKKAEGKLLASCADCGHNIQLSSNAEEKPGYIYIIKGTKMEKKEPVVKFCLDFE